MRKPAGHARPMRAGEEADDTSELELLDEFARAPSVAALADAIAARLGRRASPKELIEEAALAAAPRKPLTQGH